MALIGFCNVFNESYNILSDFSSLVMFSMTSVMCNFNLSFLFFILPATKVLDGSMTSFRRRDWSPKK